MLVAGLMAILQDGSQGKSSAKKCRRKKICADLENATEDTSEMLQKKCKKLVKECKRKAETGAVSGQTETWHRKATRADADEPCSPLDTTEFTLKFREHYDNHTTGIAMMTFWGDAEAPNTTENDTDQPYDICPTT